MAILNDLRNLLEREETDTDIEQWVWKLDKRTFLSGLEGSKWGPQIQNDLDAVRSLEYQPALKGNRRIHFK